MPQLSFQNTLINYNTSGRGDSTVLLLHGFLEDLTMWEDLTKALSADYKIISIDLLGHGNSGNCAKEHTMSLMAEMVKAVLNEENVKEAKVIGHSMGGYVALALAKNNFQLIEKIILLNSTAANDSLQKKDDRLRAVKALEAGKKQFINEAIPKLFAEQNRAIFEKEIEATKTVALKTSPEGITAALLGMRERSSFVNWTKDSTIPVVFILGEEDSIIDIKSCENQAKKTKSTIYKLKNCGHMALIESKEECFQIIQKELN